MLRQYGNYSNSTESIPFIFINYYLLVSDEAEENFSENRTLLYSIKSKRAKKLAFTLMTPSERLL